MQPQKKNSFIELFYLALLLSASRPFDRRPSLLRNPFSVDSSQIGPLSVDFYDDIRYPHLNDFVLDRYHNTKSTILQQATLDVLDDLNSLGRYSRHVEHSSNLFAYPFSGGFSGFAVSGDNSENNNNESHKSNSISTNGSDRAENDFDFDFAASDLWENLNDDPLILADDDYFQNLQRTDLSKSSTDQQTETSIKIESEEEELDFVDELDINEPPTVIDDDILYNDPLMLPALNSGFGDVNDILGDLELFLSNGTDNYDQEWQNSYSTINHNEANSEYPFYDGNQNSQFYENLNGQNFNNSTGQYSNNIGPVICSPFSNGPENFNMDMNGYNLINDPLYLSNGTTMFNNNTNDCSYNGYGNDYNVSMYNIDSGQNFEYHTLTSTPSNQNKFTNHEDCFDKSSDSAVSSMSSDRVHSLSDNDMIDTSSDSSSFNCEGNLSGSSDKCGTPQKKYHLYGKNKAQECKTVMADYYPYYSQEDCIFSDSGNSANKYNDYYSAAQIVAHNHSYAAIPIENNPLTTNSQVSVEQEIKEESDDYSSLLTPRSKVSDENSQESSNTTSRDHFNRDEKRARALNLPISTQDIINLPIDEFNERITKYELSDIQLSLIRDIRRRGKNKVAAQNCRKRKLDQIVGLQTEVDDMYSQKNALENQYNQLMMLREMARDKYTKLYQFLLEASSSRGSLFELSSSPPDFPVKDSSNELEINDNTPNVFIVSSNITTANVPISSYGIQNEFGNQQK